MVPRNSACGVVLHYWCFMTVVLLVVCRLCLKYDDVSHLYLVHIYVAVSRWHAVASPFLAPRNVSLSRARSMSAFLCRTKRSASFCLGVVYEV